MNTTTFMSTETQYSINPLVQALGKCPSEFTKQDIIEYITTHDVRIVNFRYVAADGRLKTLNFPVTDLEYLDSILSYGERVDGSSLFPYIEAGSSDLYVLPRFSTAYIDPFEDQPTLGLLCSYFTKDGLPLESSPEYVLKKAHAAFRRETGLRFEAMGELEFYLVAEDDGSFPTPDQRGYHESSPFTKFEAFRTAAIRTIAATGGKIKYGHSEVGNFRRDGRVFEQNEIEFLVAPVEEAADQLLLAKWILRTLAWKHRIDITFAPKITEGKAGSGLHFHTRLVREDGSPVMGTADGKLSGEALRAIAGYMICAPSLTAFGNTNPCSYFRLVPHQEAPTSVCWGDRNRSCMVRVPLGWTGQNDMSAIANSARVYAPGEAVPQLKGLRPDRQTVELRTGDGSADICLMLAGIVTAARIGFERADAPEIASRTYVSVNIHDAANAGRLEELEQLPSSCAESADKLEECRAYYEAGNVFPPSLIEGQIKKLRSYGDAAVREKVSGDAEAMTALVEKYYHCG